VSERGLPERRCSGQSTGRGTGGGGKSRSPAASASRLQPSATRERRLRAFERSAQRLDLSGSCSIAELGRTCVLADAVAACTNQPQTGPCFSWRLPRRFSCRRCGRQRAAAGAC
jgi:hypothetical protein